MLRLLSCGIVVVLTGSSNMDQDHSNFSTCWCTGAVLSGRIADILGRRGESFANALYMSLGTCLYSINNPQKSPRRVYYCASVVARPLRNCTLTITYFVGTVISWRTLALIGTIPCLAQLIGLLLFLNLQHGWKIQFKWNISP
ncbi:hypothetical protein ACJW30_03G191600 [Castanea mollissima]